ncbi:MAG: hypothetical protein KBS72_00520 [Bacteroidales bacterium]|nr:hypothetical protein [Candidatus Cacconaster scatequi]
MKKYIVPIFLFLAVFLTLQVYAGHILVKKGQFSLFLLTPDYFTQVFREPFPISHIILSFVIQFFDIPFVGPAVIAAIAVSLFCICHAIFRKKRVSDVLLCGLLLAGCLFIAVLPGIKRENRYCAVEQYARQHRWDELLDIARPGVVRDNRSLMPYAMLALNAKGQLVGNMGSYPLSGPQDLDTEGIHTMEAYWFSSLLDEALGNYNEAVHHLFQASCFLPQGMSNISLYQMIRFNMENENYTLARKYAGILLRSPRNYFLAKGLLKAMEGRQNRASTTDKALSPVITDSPIVNLGLLRKAGMQSAMANERLAAYLRLSVMN